MMLLTRLARLARRPRPVAARTARSASLRAVVFDFGDTLLRDFPDCTGPVAAWPRVRSMPGVRAALDHLPPHLTRCVATGDPGSDCDQLAAALARVRIRHHFPLLLTRRELGGRDKPDPAFFRAVAERLDLHPRHVLFVGDDLERDIVPAKTVGMRTVWITRLRLAKLPAEADAVIRSMRDLPRTLTRLT